MVPSPAQVDLSPAFTGNENTWTEVADVLGKSLHELGIVYLVGHGIDLKLINTVFKNSKELFGLPAETKQKYSKTNAVNHFNGYSGLGFESLGDDPQNTYEVKESFDISVPNPVFPEILPEFKTTVEQFITAIENLKTKIFKLLAKAINVDEQILLNCGNYLEGTQNYTTLRVLRYPQVSEDYKVTKNTIRCAEHYDWTIVTFLFEDSVGGLQVKTRDGEYIDANPVPDSITIIAGEILEAWTRGYFPAVLHRILVSEDDERIRQDRYSFGYFIFPDNDFVVKPFEKSEILQNEFEFTPVTTEMLVQGHAKKAH